VSKAFTSEEADDPTVPGRIPVVASEPRPITSAGHALLVDRLARAELELSRAPGDELLRHARALAEANLASVVVTPPRSDGRAGFGTTVTVRLPDGSRRAFTLVGPEEADPHAGTISVRAPVAVALLGAAPGDDVEFGDTTWRVERVVVPKS